MAMNPTTRALGAMAAAGLLAAAGCSSSDPAPTFVELGSAATSAQLQAARDAADGAGLALPIQGAFVTHVRPAAIGADPAGFTLQGQRAGPALFVAVDPATLYPTPVLVGDQVDLTVTAMATVDGRRQAAAITGYARVAWDQPVSTFVKDLSSATDVVTGLDGYEAELATLTGDVRSDFSGSGSAFVQAGFGTAALPNEPLLVLRLPTTLRDAADLALGCRVTVSAVPLWRSGTTAQATAWAAADLHVVTCPAPRVESAAALSPTEVRVQFDRVLDPASVLADGSQFTFDGGLVASAAAVSDRTVTVTTSAQGGGVAYTATVAATVRDLYGAGVDAAFDQASFTGWVTPALLVINEVNASVTGGADLVELRAVAGGTVKGAVLQVGLSGGTVLATLPDLSVATGDLLVIHLAPGAGIVTETSTKDGCSDAACYAGAWDVAGGATGIADTTRILVLETALGDVLDAVPFTDGSTTGAGTFLADLQTLQALGLWLPADCGGDLCTLTTTTPTALEISVDWSGMGTAVTGPSVRRTAAADTDLAADWAVGTSSFGAAN
jgi:hypothetical protein